VDPELIVLKESPHEVVVWKPAGMASELRDERAEDGEAREALPSEGPKAPWSVRSLVARRCPGSDPKLPHRLDRVTRGLLVVALTPEAIAFHGAQLEARAWEKIYLARVAAPIGAPDALLGEHKAFLTESGGRARLVRAGGKPARLEVLGVTPVPGRPDRWHLVIRLLTGRFHQIRVMCAALGVPLAGDPLYDPLRRDPADFYLEHVILTYIDFDTRRPSTLFVPDRPDRGPLAPSVAALLDALARPEPAST